MRNEIAKAIENLASRAQVNEYDEEILERFNVSITVEYDVNEDAFRDIELVDVSVQGEKEYPNIADYVFRELSKKVIEISRENENDYLDSLSPREKREYYAWLSA